LTGDLTGQNEDIAGPSPKDEGKNSAAVELGLKGGLKGGRARADLSTARTQQILKITPAMAAAQVIFKQSSSPWDRKWEINTARPQRIWKSCYREWKEAAALGCPILAHGIISAKYVEDNVPIAEQASENGDEDSE
jgi:hypothetical protein